MADKGEQTGKEGAGERVIRSLRDIHIFIGAAALAGAVVFPQVEIFSVLAAYEAVNAVAHEGLRQAVKNRHKRKLKPA